MASGALKGLLLLLTRLGLFLLLLLTTGDLTLRRRRGRLGGEIDGTLARNLRLRNRLTMVRVRRMRRMSRRVGRGLIHDCLNRERPQSR